MEKVKVIKEYKNSKGEITGKLIITSNGLRKKINLFNHGSMTSQEDLKSSDINNIMSYYKKTNILPETKNKIAQYLDVSNIPTLEEAHDTIKMANELFMELPSRVRKLVDNNPQKLESLLNDEAYRDILIKEGLFNKVEAKQEVSSDPPAAANDNSSNTDEK